MAQQVGQRWYPSKNQLKDPDSVERSFRRLLEQHYALQDKFDAMQSAPASGTSPASTSGPANTYLLGLPVAPIDTETLADGTKLTYVKKTANFQFL